jgi:UPF0176 protein
LLPYVAIPPCNCPTFSKPSFTSQPENFSQRIPPVHVFDERISVDVNHVDKTVIGKEHFDGTPCERYINLSTWLTSTLIRSSKTYILPSQYSPFVSGSLPYVAIPCERYINCANPECNKQILVSEENEAKYLGACSYDSLFCLHG